jgi:hypothetical protein
MAAQAFKLYNQAKKKLMAGTITLPGTYKIALVKSTSNFATATLGGYHSITNEVANGSGYATGGQSLASEAWTVGASAGQYKFDANDVVWTGTGGAIGSIQACVIYASAAASAGRHLVAYASLTSTAFTLASGNTLTVQFNAAGIFTLA